MCAKELRFWRDSKLPAEPPTARTLQPPRLLKVHLNDCNDVSLEIVVYAYRALNRGFGHQHRMARNKRPQRVISY